MQQVYLQYIRFNSPSIKDFKKNLREETEREEIAVERKFIKLKKLHFQEINFLQKQSKEDQQRGSRKGQSLEYFTPSDRSMVADLIQQVGRHINAGQGEQDCLTML